MLNAKRNDLDDRGAVMKSRNRYAYLLATTNLTAIGESQFRTLCQLMDGLATEETHDAQHRLNYSVRDALSEQERFRGDIAGKKFANDTPATRAEFMAQLDGERAHLADLGKIVGTLDKLQCTALLEWIEEVRHPGSDLGIEARCAMVYKKKIQKQL